MMAEEFKERKPFILVCATPISGHITPLISISKVLLHHGHEVGFLTGTFYGEKLRQEFVSFPLAPACDFTESTLDTHFPARAKIKHARERAAFDFQHMILDAVIPQHESLQAALKSLTTGKEKGDGRDVVIICDCGFLGVLPGMLGAGIKPKGYIAIGVIPPPFSSVDTAPFGTCLLPDSTPEGRQRNFRLQSEYSEGIREVQDDFLAMLKGTGADIGTENSFLDAAARLPDYYLQLGVEGFEYPRSDLPSNFRFVGAVPGNNHGVNQLSEFWDELLEGKKVVAVSQSTMQESTPFNLIIPTINALASDPDILLVAVLAKKGATLPTSFILPNNVRVVGFIPFDILLPHVNAFVWEGGYGGVMHAIKHGVPLVVAGDGADKPEVAMRVGWSGVGLNLKTGQPTEERIAAAVKEVLADEKFHRKARELQQELRGLDCVKIIEECISSILMR